jgi:putative heme iron utilization protein
MAGTGHPMDDEKDNILLKEYFKKHINYTPTIWFINKKGHWRQKIGLGEEETKQVIENFLNE